MVHPMTLLLLLVGCAADSTQSQADACRSYCAGWMTCGDALPGNDWTECQNWCRLDDGLRDDFVTCMDDAWPESQIDTYGPDLGSCGDLYDTCSHSALAQQGG